MYKLTYDDNEEIRTKGDLSLPSPIESPKASVPSQLDDDPFEETIYKKGNNKLSSSSFTYATESNHNDNARQSSTFQSSFGQDSDGLQKQRKKRVLSIANINYDENFPTKRDFIKNSIYQKLKCCCGIVVALIILALIASVVYLYVLVHNYDVTISVTNEKSAFSGVNESDAEYAELTKLDYYQRPPDVSTDDEIRPVGQQRPPTVGLKPPSYSPGETPPPAADFRSFEVKEGVSHSNQEKELSANTESSVNFHGFRLSQKTPGLEWKKHKQTYRLTASPRNTKMIYYNYEMMDRKNEPGEKKRFVITENDLYKISIKFCTGQGSNEDTATVQLLKNSTILREFRTSADPTSDVMMEPGFKFEDSVAGRNDDVPPATPSHRVMVRHSFNVKEELLQGDVLQLQLYSGTLVELSTRSNTNVCLHFTVQNA